MHVVRMLLLVVVVGCGAEGPTKIDSDPDAPCAEERELVDQRNAEGVVGNGCEFFGTPTDCANICIDGWTGGSVEGVWTLGEECQAEWTMARDMNHVHALGYQWCVDYDDGFNAGQRDE
jgi:hypothetical protein